MRTIFITGTSSGVGAAAAALFARQGFKVFATMRNLKKADSLRSLAKEEELDIEVLEVDVTKPDTIQKAVQSVIDSGQQIDILLNNAGAGFAKPVEHASDEEIQWVANVNYLGVVRTTKAVLPFMREAKSGHIINVSSVGGLVGQPFNELYCAAKFAIEGFNEALATYVSDPFNIKFTNVEPGGIATEFMNSAVEKTKDESGELAPKFYEDVFTKYVADAQSRAASDDSPYQTADEVAQVIYQVATMENPPIRIRTSEWAESLCQLKTAADPDGTKLVGEMKAFFLKD